MRKEKYGIRKLKTKVAESVLIASLIFGMVVTQTAPMIVNAQVLTLQENEVRMTITQNDGTTDLDATASKIFNLEVEITGKDKSIANGVIELGSEIEEGISMTLRPTLPNGWSAITIGTKQYLRFNKLTSGTRVTIPISVGKALRDYPVKKAYQKLGNSPFKLFGKMRETPQSNEVIKSAEVSGNILIFDSRQFKDGNGDTSSIGSEQGTNILYGGIKRSNGEIIGKGVVNSMVTLQQTDTKKLLPNVVYKVEYDKEKFKFLGTNYFLKINGEDYLTTSSTHVTIPFRFQYIGNDEVMPNLTYSLKPVYTNTTLSPAIITEITEDLPMAFTKTVPLKWNVDDHPLGNLLTTSNHLSWIQNNTTDIQNYPKNQIAKLNWERALEGTSSLMLNEVVIQAPKVNAMTPEFIKVSIPKTSDGDRMKVLEELLVEKVSNYDKEMELWGVRDDGSEQKLDLTKRVTSYHTHFLGDFNSDTKLDISEYTHLKMRINPFEIAPSEVLKIILTYGETNLQESKHVDSYPQEKSTIANSGEILDNSFKSEITLNGNENTKYESNITTWVIPPSQIGMLSYLNNSTTSITSTTDVLQMNPYLAGILGEESFNANMFMAIVPKDILLKNLPNSNFKIESVTQHSPTENKYVLKFGEKDRLTIPEFKALAKETGKNNNLGMEYLPIVLSKAITTTTVPYKIVTGWIHENTNIKPSLNDEADIDKDGKLFESAVSDRGTNSAESRELNLNILVPKALYIYDNHSKDKSNYEVNVENVQAGNSFAVKPIITNSSTGEYNNLSMISILPYANDKNFESNQTRGNTVTPTLKQNSIVTPSGWKAWVTTEAQNGNGNTLGNWVELNNFTDWENAKAIKWTSNTGVTVGAGSVVDGFGYELNVAGNTISDTKIYTSSAVAVNGNNTYLEGFRASTTVFNPIKYGTVNVKYVDTYGVVLKTETPYTNAEVGTEFDVSNKPNHVDYQNQRYYFKELKNDSYKTNGQIEEGTNTVTFVYELPTTSTSYSTSSLKVNYQTADGTVLKPQETVITSVNHTKHTHYRLADGREVNKVDEALNPTYSVTRTNEIQHTDTFTYRLVREKDNKQDSGNLSLGENTLTYIYEAVPKVTTTEEKGKVIVKYLEENTNTPIDTEYVTEEKLVNTKREETLPSGTTTTNTPSNERYNVLDKRKTTIQKEDKEYEIISSTGASTGTLAIGDNVVTHYYTPVTRSVENITGSIVIKYQDEQGNELKADHNLIENGVVTSIHKKTVKGNTTVTDTIDHTVNYNGDTEELKPTTLNKNDFTYSFLRAEGLNATGELTEGTHEIIYVYSVQPKVSTVEEKGKAVVKFVLEDTLEEIKETFNDLEKVVNTKTTTTLPTGESVQNNPTYATYDVTDTKENAINTDTKEYEYVSTDGELTGELVVGDNVITHKYTEVTRSTEEKRGTIIVKYQDAEGNKIKEDVTLVNNELLNTIHKKTVKGNTTTVSENPLTVPYTVEKLETINFNEFDYTYASANGDLTGVVTEGTREIILTYNVTPKISHLQEKGTLTVEYVDKGGNKIAENVTVINDELVNTKTTTTYPNRNVVTDTPTDLRYDVESLRHETVSKDTFTYTFDSVEGDKLTAGVVEKGTNIIRFVYNVVPKITTEEVKGNVTVKFHDENGNEIKSSIQVQRDVLLDTITTTTLPSGETVTHNETDENYDVTNYKENEIVFNEFTYLFKNSNELTGKILKGENDIILVYQVQPKVSIVEEKGNLIISYVNEKGEEILPTVTKEETLVKVTTTTTLPSGETVNVENKEVPYEATKENKFKKDGLTYVLDKVEGIEKGNLQVGENKVTYIYKAYKVPSDYPTIEIKEKHIEKGNPPTNEINLEKPKEAPKITPKEQPKEKTKPVVDTSDNTNLFGLLGILSVLGLRKRKDREE